MQQVAPFVNLGLTLTHGLVPPTPGILAVSILLGADIGTVIIIGLICSFISFAVCYLGLRPVYAKGEYVAPLPQYTEGIEAVEDTNDVNALLIKEDNTPSSGASFAPLLLPAVMIAIGSIGKLFIAGIVPGILIAVCLMAYAVFYCIRKGEDRNRIDAKTGSAP